MICFRISAHYPVKSMILNYIIFSFLRTGKEISSLWMKRKQERYFLFFETFLHNPASWFEYCILRFVHMYNAQTLRSILPWCLSWCSTPDHNLSPVFFFIDIILLSTSRWWNKMKEFFPHIWVILSKPRTTPKEAAPSMVANSVSFCMCLIGAGGWLISTQAVQKYIVPFSRYLNFSESTIAKKRRMFYSYVIYSNHSFFKPFQLFKPFSFEIR